MSTRQIRVEAAHRELGSRHPWLTILGRPVAAVFGVVVLAAALVWLGRLAWRAVSAAMAPDPSVVPAPVSTAVSPAVSGPVSWVPWWGWVVLALVVLAVLVRYVPRLAFKIRWGIWPSH